MLQTFDANNDFQKNNFLTWEDAFYVNSGNIYMSGYPYNKYEDKNYDDLFRKNVSSRFIYTFGKNKKFMEFRETGAARSKYPFSMFYRWEDFEIFGTNKNVYAFITIFPEIYDYKKERFLTSVVDTNIIKSYVFARDYEETGKKDNIPFSIYCYTPISNNRLLAIFYYHNKDFFIAIYDARMNLIDRKKITQLIDLKSELLNYNFLPFFSDNYLNMIFCKEGNCINRRISLSVPALNENALPKDEFFEK